MSAADGQAFAFCARGWQGGSNGMGSLLTKVVLCAAQKPEVAAAAELAGDVSDTRPQDLKVTTTGSATATGGRNRSLHLTSY